MIWKDVEKKYGKRMANKMKNSQFLECITCTELPNGETDIPERDIENAYADVMGKHVPEEAWD